MNFTITQLDRNTDGGVIQAHWTVTKTIGENTASRYGSTTFNPDSTAEGYIAYDSLNESIVINWVQEAEDTTKLENNINRDLDELTSPSILTGKPW